MKSLSFIGWALVLGVFSVILAALFTYLGSISTWIEAVTRS